MIQGLMKNNEQGRGCGPKGGFMGVWKLKCYIHIDIHTYIPSEAGSRGAFAPKNNVVTDMTAFNNKSHRKLYRTYICIFMCEIRPPPQLSGPFVINVAAVCHAPVVRDVILSRVAIPGFCVQCFALNYFFRVPE